MEIENPTIVPSSQHPILRALNEKITHLEDKVLQEEQFRRQVLISKLNFEERVKKVLVEALELHDEDTVKHIASNLDISMTLSKSYEVNVTFRVDLELEIGEDIDPEWDFGFKVDGHNGIVDYSSDVIWSNEIDS
jgi:phage-related protein